MNFFVCYLNEYWWTIDWCSVILYEENLSIISVSCRAKWSIWIHQDLLFCFLINVVKHEFSLYIQCLVCSSNSITTTFTGWLWILVMISVGDDVSSLISLVLGVLAILLVSFSPLGLLLWSTFSDELHMNATDCI